MNLSLDQSEGSVLSDDVLDTPDDLDINVDDIETPDETDSLEFINNGNDLEWEGQTFELCFSFFFFLQSFDFVAFWLQITVTCGHADDHLGIIFTAFRNQSGREDASSL